MAPSVYLPHHTTFLVARALRSALRELASRAVTTEVSVSETSGRIGSVQMASSFGHLARLNDFYRVLVFWIPWLVNQ